MKLTEVATLIADARDITHETYMCYDRAARCFGHFLGRPATTDDLSEATVNKWLRSLEGEKKAETILGRKRGITAIWNFAAEQGDADRFYQSQKLRRIRLTYKPVVPWSNEQLTVLLEAASQLEGNLASGIPAAKYMTAAILTHYETGIRPGDLRSLCWSDIDLEAKRIAIVQNKTRNAHVGGFSQRTADALKAIHNSKHGPFTLGKSATYRWERKLYKMAESLGFARQKGQALGYIRKSHGTEVAREHGIEAAAKSLGHVSGTLIARRHYVAGDAIGFDPKVPSLKQTNGRRDTAGTRTSTPDRRRSSGGRDGSQRDQSVA